MCRIAGFWDFNYDRTYDRTRVLEKMRDTMAYGGPDNAGAYVDQAVALGHRRLSILDLSSAGHQPMEWQNYVLDFNGEIYNFKEIRQELIVLGHQFRTETDGEVILKGYHQWGKGVVDRFRGMFAFAIWDKSAQKLILCRDRVGVKPLYWYWKNGLFLFGSELKSFHQHPKFDKRINQSAVALHLQQGYIHAPHCIFHYAHKLEGGKFLELDTHQQIQISNYWDIFDIYNNATTDTRSEDEIAEELEAILLDSFQLRLVSDVPVGMFLSGGIDSTLVTAMLQKHNNTQLNTFTIGFEEASKNEAHHAKAIAQHIGTKHTELYCSESDFLRIFPKFSQIYDEPYGDSSGIPTFLVSELAREQVTVSLSADGGDELFGGYTKYEITKNYFPKLQKIPLPIRQLLAGIDIDWLSKNASRIPVLRNYKDVAIKLHKFNNALGSKDAVDFFHAASQFINKKQIKQLTNHAIPRLPDHSLTKDPQRVLSLLGALDIKTYLEGDILTKVDRATMQVALEGREPFLDQHIIEFSQSIPDNLKIKNKETKYLLKKILYHYVPKRLTHRPKQGFSVPLDTWLKTHLKQELLAAVSQNNSFLETFELTDKVRQLVLRFCNGKHYVAPDFIWFVYTLYLWDMQWRSKTQC